MNLRHRPVAQGLQPAGPLGSIWDAGNSALRTVRRCRVRKVVRTWVILCPFASLHGVMAAAIL